MRVVGGGHFRPHINICTAHSGALFGAFGRLVPRVLRQLPRRRRFDGVDPVGGGLAFPSHLFSKCIMFFLARFFLLIQMKRRAGAVCPWTSVKPVKNNRRRSAAGLEMGGSEGALRRNLEGASVRQRCNRNATAGARAPAVANRTLRASPLDFARPAQRRRATLPVGAPPSVP